MPNKLDEIISSDGYLGLLEKAFSVLKKELWTVYYRFRFKKFGRGSKVTGPISLKGGKRIEIGDEVVIEEGTLFRADSKAFIKIGNRCFVDKGTQLISEGELFLASGVSLLNGVFIASGGCVRLGERVWVARESSLTGENITLEADVILGPGVYIMDGDHQIDSKTGQVKMNAGVRKPVCIKTNAWVGARSIVLKGVTIGERAVIGAGSVVTRDIPSHCVAVGVPAKAQRNVISNS